MDDIYNFVLPGVDQFIESLSAEFEFSSQKRKGLDKDEISKHFEKAKVFALLLRRKYGTPMIDSPIQTLLNAPMKELKDLTKLRENVHRGIILEAT